MTSRRRHSLITLAFSLVMGGGLVVCNPLLALSQEPAPTPVGTVTPTPTPDGAIDKMRNELKEAKDDLNDWKNRNKPKFEYMKTEGKSARSDVQQIRNSVDMGKAGAKACLADLDKFEAQLDTYLDAGANAQALQKMLDSKMKLLDNGVKKLTKFWDKQLQQVQTRIDMLQTSLQKCAGGAYGMCVALPGQIKYFKTLYSALKATSYKKIKARYDSKVKEMKGKVKDFPKTVEQKWENTKQRFNPPKLWTKGEDIFNKCRCVASGAGDALNRLPKQADNIDKHLNNIMDPHPTPTPPPAATATPTPAGWTAPTPAPTPVVFPTTRPVCG